MTLMVKITSVVTVGEFRDGGGAPDDAGGDDSIGGDGRGLL